MTSTMATVDAVSWSFVNFEVHSSHEANYISEKEKLDEDNEIHVEPGNQ